jgi:hypothetical protein
MLVKEEVSRIKELMSLQEQGPGFVDDSAKIFAKQIAKIFKKLMVNSTDEEIATLLKKNTNEVRNVLTKVRNASANNIESLSLDSPLIDDLLKIIDDVDLASIGNQAYFSGFDSVFKPKFIEKAAEWNKLTPEEFSSKFAEWKSYWYNKIVNEGFGKFDDSNPMPENAKPFYEAYYEGLVQSFNNVVKRTNPNVDIDTKKIDNIVPEVPKPKVDYQDVLQTKKWNDVEPLSADVIAQLAKNNKAWPKAWNNLQTYIKDYFADSSQQVEELLSLIKNTSAEQPKELKVIKNRISELTERLQQKETGFYEAINRWIDQNIIGMPTLKGDLKALTGYGKAKKLSDETTVKELDKKFGDYTTRAAKLREQWYDLVLKWGKTWQKKYSDQSSKISTILKSDKFKELRNSYKLGTTLSPTQWGEIIRELGIPSGVAKLGKEYMLQYVYYNSLKALLETIWEGISYFAYSSELPGENFWKSQIYNEDGELEITTTENAKDRMDQSYSIFKTLVTNLVESFTEFSGLFPGLMDDTGLAILKAWGVVTGNSSNNSEDIERVRNSTENLLDTTNSRLDSLRNRAGNSETTEPTRLLIPNDLESLFPQELVANIKRDGAMSVNKFKYVISDGTKTYEYAIQKKQFENENGTITTKWAIELPIGSGEFYPLDSDGTMTNIIAASR